jgi:hypothetical protein
VSIPIPANRKILIIVGGLAILLQYQNALSSIIREQSHVVSGPQEASSVEAFDYICQHISDNSVIVFKKPKALALYTHKKTTSTLFDQSSADVASMLKQFGDPYLLLHTDLSDEPLKKYIMENQNNVRLIWKNERFTLYQKW